MTGRILSEIFSADKVSVGRKEGLSGEFGKVLDIAYLVKGCLFIPLVSETNHALHHSLS